MSKTLGGAVANQSKALIALSSVTKSFVDDLVAAGECRGHPTEFGWQRKCRC